MYAAALVIREYVEDPERSRIRPANTQEQFWCYTLHEVARKHSLDTKLGVLPADISSPIILQSLFLAAAWCEGNAYSTLTRISSISSSRQIALSRVLIRAESDEHSAPSLRHPPVFGGDRVARC